MFPIINSVVCILEAGWGDIISNIFYNHAANHSRHDGHFRAGTDEYLGPESTYRNSGTMTVSVPPKFFLTFCVQRI